MKKIVDFVAFHSSTIVAVLGVATAILNVMAQKKDSAEEIKKLPSALYKHRFECKCISASGRKMIWIYF